MTAGREDDDGQPTKSADRLKKADTGSTTTGQSGSSMDSSGTPQLDGRPSPSERAVEADRRRRESLKPPPGTATGATAALTAAVDGATGGSGGGGQTRHVSFTILSSSVGDETGFTDADGYDHKGLTDYL